MGFCKKLIKTEVGVAFKQQIISLDPGLMLASFCLDLKVKQNVLKFKQKMSKIRKKNHQKTRKKIIKKIVEKIVENPGIKNIKNPRKNHEKNAEKS